MASDLNFAYAPQIVASVSIEMAGGPAVPLLPGRPDCVDCFDDANGLPSECFTLDELVDFWGMVALAVLLHLLTWFDVLVAWHSSKTSSSWNITVN